MTTNQTIAPATCCTTHDGPHLHGCIRPRTEASEHGGICIKAARA